MRQETLFNPEEDKVDFWSEEWEGMPEFVQEKADKPYNTIIIRFRTKEDMDEFSKLIGQKLTSETNNIWHPKLIKGINSNKVYSDES